RRTALQPAPLAPPGPRPALGCRARSARLPVRAPRTRTPPSVRTRLSRTPRHAIRCARSGERRRLHRAARPPTAPAEPRSVEGEGGRALARRVLVETLRPPSDANVSVTSRPAMGDISG